MHDIKTGLGQTSNIVRSMTTSHERLKSSLNSCTGTALTTCYPLATPRHQEAHTHTHTHAEKHKHKRRDSIQTPTHMRRQTQVQIQAQKPTPTNHASSSADQSESVPATTWLRSSLSCHGWRLLQGATRKKPGLPDSPAESFVCLFVCLFAGVCFCRVMYFWCARAHTTIARKWYLGESNRQSTFKKTLQFERAGD